MRCGSSPLPSAFLSFALWRGAVQCVCTVTALPPGSISVRAHRWKYISKRAAKPCGLCLLLRKKLSIDTASVCVDFALPLVFAGVWESAAGSESKAAVVGAWAHPQWWTEGPVLGTQCQSQMVIFTTPHIPWVSSSNQSVCSSDPPISLFRELMLTWNYKMGECRYKAVTKRPIKAAYSSWQWWFESLSYYEQQ